METQEKTREPVIAEIVSDKDQATRVMTEVAEGLGGMPTMQVQAPTPPEQGPKVVSVEELQGYFQEAIGWIRTDRADMDDKIANLYDMIINGGDASGPTKEAFCNLIRLKHETSSSLTKLIDLMMRSVLKERDTFKPYMNNTQHNEFKINPRRKIVERFAKKALDNKRSNGAKT